MRLSLMSVPRGCNRRSVTDPLPDARDGHGASSAKQCRHIGTSFAKAQKSKATWHRNGYGPLVGQLMFNIYLAFSLATTDACSVRTRNNLDRRV
ncbi:hypothetical protein GGS26DRAFT_376410 [Hypomontagnella submonticulosa]|nr:hypothetical protein GGS26DRAFT_376410 [Hypomontagnella submonticulosa]